MIEAKPVERRYRLFMPNRGVATDLQYYGGKTNLIDFNEDVLVALSFACLGKERPQILFTSLDDKPNDAQAYYDRAVAKSRINNVEGAIADFDQAIQLQPNHAEAYFRRGTAKSRHLGQHQEAIADFNQAIKLQPNHVDAYNNRGIAKGELGRYKEAIADFDEAIKRQSDRER